MANPYVIGTASKASGTSIAINVTTATSPGDKIVVAIVAHGGANLSSASDSQLNSYPTIVNDTGGLGPTAGIGIADGSTTALGTSDTITANLSSSRNNIAAVAIGVPTGSTVSALDLTGWADSAGTPPQPSITTGTLAQAKEFVIAVECSANAGGSPAWGGSFTALSTTQQGTGPFLSVAYEVTSSTATVTASATITTGTSVDWAMLAATFKISSTVTVTTTSLPSATQSSAYTPVQLTASGGSGTYTWSITSGALPGGMSLSSGGSISGTPTVSGTFTFTVQANDGTTNGTKSLTLTVNPAATPGVPYLIGTASAASGGSTTLNVPVNQNVAQGDVINIAVLADSAGVVPSVGTDTGGNSYSLVFSQTGQASAQLYVFESDGVGSLQSGVDSIPVTYSSTASNQGAIAIGDNNVTTYDKLNSSNGSSTAPSSGATGTLSQKEENLLGFIVNNVAGGTPAWQSAWSPHVLANLTANAATSISVAYKTVTSTATQTASGTITSAAWSCGVLSHLVAPPIPQTVLSDGVAGETYNQTLVATGGVAPYSWAVTGLPVGVSVSGNTVTGIPTVPGTYTVVATATDAFGLTASYTQTINIFDSSVTGIATFPFPNNLLSRADSDFSTGGVTWAASQNATAPALAVFGLSGASSLMWSAAANGQSQVSTGFYNVSPGLPYIASGFMLPPGARDCQIGIAWYTSSNTLIRTDYGPDNASPSISWQSLTFAGTAPSNAAKAKLVLLAQEANAGDTIHADLLYLAQSGVQVLIDWINPVFTSQGGSTTGGSGGLAGQDFMDVSPFLRFDQGITLVHGRRDTISEVQPATATFSLQNDTGLFTRDKATSLVTTIGGQVTLHRRYQVNLTDELGAWYTRGDGTLAEPDYAWDPTGNTNMVNCNGTDILAALNRADNLTSWTRETVLADGPLFHWRLNDSGNAKLSGVMSETSGNNGPNMRVINSDNTKTATLVFQQGAGGVETLADAVAPAKPDGGEFWTQGSNQPSSQLRGLDSGAVGPYSSPEQSPAFTPNLVSQAARNYFTGNIGYMLQAKTPVLDPTQNSYSFECWFMMDPNIAASAAGNYGPFIVMSMASTRGAQTLVAGLFLTGTTTLNFEVNEYTQPPGFNGQNFPGTPPIGVLSSLSTTVTADTVSLPHHVVVVVSQDPANPVVTAYLDGVQLANSLTLPNRQVFDTFTLGGAWGATGCFQGAISLASIYEYALSPQQIINHCSVGQYGMWESTTDDCIAQIASFAGIPPFWNNLEGNHFGLTLADYQSLAGTNPIAAMQTYEQAEDGLLFTDTSGALNFHTRDYRMGHGAPDLLLPPDTYSADLSYALIDQFMVNEMAVGTTVFTSGTAEINQESQEKYGVYARSTADSPLQLPLITFNRAFGQLGITGYSFFSDPNLDDRAQWEVNAHSEPWAFPATVNIDLLTLDKVNTGVGISNIYTIDVDDMIAPTGTLPASFPDSGMSLEWFVEGMTETISSNDRTIQFYCSPAETQRAWIPGDTTYGVLGQTSRIGISAADTNQTQADGKDVAHDAGRPYWPPSFPAGMNSPSGANNGFIGSLEMRGLTDNLQLALQPPMLCVGATGATQTIPAGSNSTPQIFWDTIYTDTVGGMGLAPGWPNWYVCLVPGFYDIDASLVWTGVASGGMPIQGWLIVAQQAAQALAAGTGTPTTAPGYICPIGEQQRVNGSTFTMADNPVTRIYLGLGDMVAIAGEQATAGSRTTSTGFGGSRMSLIWRGWGEQDDRVMVNSSIVGGSVAPIHSKVTNVKTYNNTHTYSYNGGSGQSPYARIFDTGSTTLVHQGVKPGNYKVTGVETGQVSFSSKIHNDLNVAGTVTINFVTLTCQNLISYYKSGSKLMVGWSTQTPGGSTFNPSTVSNRDVFEESFATGASKTFTLPSSVAKAFQGSATMLVIGNGWNQNAEYYGRWLGGSSTWQLTIGYTVVN